MANYVKKKDESVDIKQPEAAVETSAEEAKTTDKVVSTTTAAAEKVFAPTDPISCRSIFAGEALFEGKKTKNLYVFANYNDVCDIEYQDLLSAKLVKSAFIYKPIFIIDDEEVLAQKKWEDVAELYKKLYSLSEIEDIFNLSNSEFETVLSQMPKGMQQTIATIATDKILRNEFDSLSKIKIMDKVLGTELITYIS